MCGVVFDIFHPSCLDLLRRGWVVEDDTSRVCVQDDSQILTPFLDRIVVALHHDISGGEFDNSEAFTYRGGATSARIRSNGTCISPYANIVSCTL